MEALLGILIGSILGFFMGLLKTHFDRQRTKRDMAEALLTEIPLDKKGLRSALDVFSKEKNKGRLTRPRGATFTRIVYAGRIGDLALLPRHIRYTVQNFYACVSDVEFLVDTAQEWDSLDTSDKKYLVDGFVKATGDAIERAGEAIRQLHSVTES
jgi:hypothetical protein